MNGYLERLARLDSGLPPAEERLILLTGQSSFTSSSLSPSQILFLEAVAPVGCSVLRTGFPFDTSFDGAGFQVVGMMGASWRNALQVYWSMYTPEFCEAVARRLQAVLDATSRRLILIAGSCGLQMANATWPLLLVPAGLQVDVVALGPACFDALRMPATVVQGRRDGWSRLFYRGPVDHVCNCGHLDYWDSDEVKELLR